MGPVSQDFRRLQEGWQPYTWQHPLWICQSIGDDDDDDDDDDDNDDDDSDGSTHLKSTYSMAETLHKPDMQDLIESL